ncbi:hypothetical protein AGABI1DRAFT_116174, partial [Agaricus bisporus var. burnettii JB137-S8]
MEIHIPRSYNGPITIHVATGNLDEHILFSREVKERSVVLREGRFARGCFIGRQGFDDDDDDDDGGEDGAGGDKGSGVCEACRKNQDQNDEKQKAVASSTTTAIPGTSTGPTPADVLSKSTTPLHIVKRKPAKSLSLQNSEKTSISSSLSPSVQEAPSSPPPPPATTTTTTTKPISDSPSPIPSSTTPLDILTNRPSFLDVDPMNGRARRSSEFHLTMAPYKSSPLRYSMTSSLSSSSSSSSPPPLPLSLEERRRRERERREAEAEGGRGGGEKREWVSLLNQGEEGRGGVVGSTSSTPTTSVVAMPEPVVDKVGEGEGDGKRPKIVRLDEMSSLPSSSEEEEENENDGDGGGSGSGSGSDTYESAESAIGNETAEETSTQMVSQNQQEKEEEQPEV